MDYGARRRGQSSDNEGGHEVNKQGKCLYCAFHKLIGKKFSCRNKAEGVHLKETHKYDAPTSKALHLPHACATSGLEESYPEEYSPASLEGECENWEEKSYAEEKG